MKNYYFELCNLKNRPAFYPCASLRRSGSFCLTRGRSSHGSALRPARRFPRLRTVYWLPALVRESSSQVTGTETGAPSRSRDEYAASEVRSSELRKKETR